MAKWRNSPLKQKKNPEFNSTKRKVGGKGPDLNVIKRKLLSLALLNQIHVDNKKAPKKGSLSIISDSKKDE